MLKLKGERNSLEAEMLEMSEELRKTGSQLGAAQDRIQGMEQQAQEKEAEHEDLQQDFLKLQAEHVRLQQADQGIDKKSMQDALAKLNNAQEAMEGVLTCMNCMEVYQGPMTYIPCGHTFCKECVESSKGRNGGEYRCDECGSSRPVKSVTSNSLIDEVAGKFSYQKQVLDALQKQVL